MKRFLLFISAVLVFSVCYAQQSRPIIVDGRYAADSSSAEQAQATTPQDVNAQLEVAQGEINKANYTRAKDIALELLNRNVEDPRVYSMLAFCYQNLEDYDNAVYYATQAIAKRPSDADAYTIRGFSQYKKGDILRATEDIDTALKLNPKASRAQKVKDTIAQTKTAALQEKARARQADKESLPPWFLVYVICVLSVITAFMVFRYRGAFAHSREDRHDKRLKEVNIKEQYHFIRMVGEGGMGKVYEAYDNVLKRKVAVKRIKPELLKSNYVREQFLSEARMVAMLHHPCIVEIYTVIETTNSLYLVFEYVEGQTLETRLDIDSYIPFDEAKEIFGSVCKGLAFAHANDIVHCDLKPGNIMISDSGIAKVMDFGVAKKVAADGKQTDSRTVAGTPAYMSPEQQKGFMTKQSDIYSLGVCLYEALVGQVPWAVKGFDISTKKIVPPSDFSAAIPKEVDRLIARAIQDDPEKRVQSVEEFWDILKNAQAVTKA